MALAFLDGSIFVSLPPLHPAGERQPDGGQVVVGRSSCCGWCARTIILALYFCSFLEYNIDGVQYMVQRLLYRLPAVLDIG